MYILLFLGLTPCALPSRLGEVFVLNDGAEVDLDLGNYERFLDVTLTRDNNITSGKIFQHVIEKEVGLRSIIYQFPIHLSRNIYLNLVLSNRGEVITWGKTYKQSLK